jgi:hypothetical protein
MNISDALHERFFKAGFPRASSYDPQWIMDNCMGPHVLWLAEWLSQAEMLCVDNGRTFCFARVVAQRPADSN